MSDVADDLRTGGKTMEGAGGAGSLMSRISASRSNYWASYVTDFACPCLFAFLGRRSPWSWGAAGLSVLFGVVVFSLVEYSIHRWLLHDPRSALFHLHAAHHNDAEKLTAFFFPTSMLVLVPIWFGLTHGLHLQHSAYFLCGFSAGYCYFGVLHHVEHTTRINHLPFRWLKSRWAAHSVHHHLDQTNYGVMTSLWDYVFGTQQIQAKRKRMRA